MTEFDGESAQLEEHNLLQLALDAARHGRQYVEPQLNYGSLKGSPDDEPVARGPRREPTRTVRRRGAE